MELEKLLVKIEADLSGLKKGLAEAQGQVKKSTGGFNQAFNNANASLDRFSSTALKVGGVLAVAFGAVQIKNIAQVGIQIENLTVRLQALFGSAQEGSKAFEEMVKFASQVPFTLEEIQRGSGSLAVVSGDAEDLGRLLKITGNVAAVTGLDFKMASEQIQRSLSSGIASADMFRERGVTAMLGFQQGVSVSVEETERKLMEVFGPGGKFGNAADELAKTLTGTLSMIGDKFFKVQTAISDGFFDELKAELKEFDRTLERNEMTIAAYGNVIGQAIGDAIRGIGESVSGIMTSLKVFASFVLGTFISGKLLAGFALLLDVIKKINAGLKTTAVLSATLSGGFLGLIARVLSAVAVFIGLNKQLDGLTANVKKANKELAFQKNLFEGINEVYDLSARGVASLRKEQDKTANMTAEQKRLFKELGEGVTDLNKIFEGFGQAVSDAFGEAVISGKNFGDSMVKIFDNVLAQIVSLITQLLIMEPLLKEIRAAIEGAQTEAAKSGGSIIDVLIGAGTDLIFGGKKAKGGFVRPNVAYTVGEQGPETFVPRTAGTIIPNQEGVTINQNISFSTGIVPTVRAEVMNLLPTIKQQTLTAVVESRARGGKFAKTFGA